MTVGSKQGRRVIRAAQRASAPLRSLPSFFVIGAMRCGTSSLYRYLNAHPSCTMPSKKEIHYFDIYRDRPPSWYQAFFPFRRQGQITGEITPSYLAVMGVRDRVHAQFPQAKLIAMLRDPVQRVISHHSARKRNGMEPRDLNSAVLAELDGEPAPSMLGEIDRALDIPYLVGGHYAAQLEHWLDRFPRSAFLIVDNADLDTDPVGTIGEMYRFLGLEPYAPVSFKRHGTTKPAEVAPEVRERLADYYESHDRALARLLGRPLSWM